METLKAKVVITGLTPLLMHNPEGQMKRGPTTRNVPTPEAEAEAGTYRLADGSLYVKTVAPEKSIVQGASEFKVGKRSLKSVISGMISDYDPPERIPLTRNGNALKEYDEIDTQRAVVQGQGILRSRPKINPPWDLAFDIIFDPVTATLSHVELIEQVINRAGRTVGILDQRPGSPKNKSGRYGKYTIKSYEIISDGKEDKKAKKK